MRAGPKPKPARNISQLAAGINEILSTLRDFATRPQDLLKFLRIMN